MKCGTTRVKGERFGGEEIGEIRVDGGETEKLDTILDFGEVCFGETLRTEGEYEFGILDKLWLAEFGELNMAGGDDCFLAGGRINGVSSHGRNVGQDGGDASKDGPVNGKLNSSISHV